MATYIDTINAALYTESGDDVYGKPLDGNLTGTDWDADSESAIEVSDTNVYEIELDETKGYIFYRNEHQQSFTADSGTDVITANAHGLINGETLRFKGVSYSAISITVGSGDLAGNVINATAHGYSTGMRVRFTGSALPTPLVEGTDYYVFTVPDANTFTLIGVDITATGSGTVKRLNLPAPLVPITLYYVRDVTENTFKVAATGVGAAINLTDNGSSTMMFTAPSMRSKDSDLKIGTAPIIKAATLTAEGEEQLVAAIVASAVGTNAATSATQTAPAAIRTAVGMATANLDTQMAAITAKTNLIGTIRSLIRW